MIAVLLRCTFDKCREASTFKAAISWQNDIGQPRHEYQAHEHERVNQRFIEHHERLSLFQ